MKLAHLLVIGSIALSSVAFQAKGGTGSHHPRISSLAPGTGSKSSSEHVKGYTKKDGTHVDSYRKSDAG